MRTKAVGPHSPEAAEEQGQSLGGGDILEAFSENFPQSFTHAPHPKPALPG